MIIRYMEGLYGTESKPNHSVCISHSTEFTFRTKGYCRHLYIFNLAKLPNIFHQISYARDHVIMQAKHRALTLYSFHHDEPKCPAIPKLSPYQA